MSASAEAEGGSEALLREPWEELGRQSLAGQFGIWVFLASEVLFFGALLLTYAVYRWTFPEGFAAAARETNVVYGTVNTALLLTSSFTIATASQLAKEAGAERLDPSARRLVTLLLAGTAALGAAFLVVKGFEYREDLAKDLWPGAGFALRERGADIFFALYWLITGVHAVHLSIGIALVSRLVVIAWRDRRPLARNPQVEAATLYWHLVDIVWIFVYPLIYLPGRSG